MNVAAILTWIGRFVFLALFYLFIYRIYRALVSAHGIDRLPAPLARVVLVATESTSQVWLEEGGGKERRLGESASIPVNKLLSLGRGQENRLRITDPHISHRHCVIRRDKDGYILEDLGTTNGTYVDGTRVNGTARLHSQSEIVVGPVQFRFEVT